jgi:hypothetical protein
MKSDCHCLGRFVAGVWRCWLDPNLYAEPATALAQDPKAIVRP